MLSRMLQLLVALCFVVFTVQQEQNATQNRPHWGELPTPNFAVLQDENAMTGASWGSGAPNESFPKGGKVRRYHLRVTREDRAPDGYNKSMMLVNGQFPGPLLEANWGDTFEITVSNSIPNEGITLHWHGFTQKNTSGYDGVPGVSQCPIAPGKSYTYRFQADQFGTTWYHSHYSAQYSDGLFGPMIVHGPKQPDANYDLDLGPIMLHDYSYESYYSIAQNFLVGPPKVPRLPVLDNNLINGKGLLNCSIAPSPCFPRSRLAKFSFTTGKTHRLRLIHTGSSSNQKFSIEGHTITVITNDFTPVVPYQTDVVTLAIGQRVDILVTATGRPKDIVWMHSEIDVPCTGLTTSNTHGLAAIYYPSADTTKLPPTLQYPTWPSNDCLGDLLDKTVPFWPIPLPPMPGTTETLNITLMNNESGVPHFLMNGESFVSDYNHPILSAAKLGQSTWPADRNVFDFGTNSSVRLIVVNTVPGLMHPMHLHGHNFWVLAEGFGQWDGRIVRPSNPQRRDTHIMAPASTSQSSFVVLEWAQDNPGVWPFHCHIAGHLSDGLYINVLERRDSIMLETDIPKIVAQSCTDWQAWTDSHTVDQIDSGV